MLERNSVFLIHPGWKEAPFTGLCRFLATDGEDAAVIIALPVDTPENEAQKQPLKGPVTVPLTELLHHIEEGNISLSKNSTSRMTMGGLSEAGQKVFHRNRVLIDSLKIDDAVLLCRTSMSQLLKDAEKKHGISGRTIRRILYAYYAGGLTELALIPDFEKRGGPGHEQKAGTARRGRKATSPYLKGNASLPDIREKLRSGVEKHYLPGKKKFRDAFVETLKEHFSRKNADSSEKELEAVLVPEEERPTKWQFRNMIRIVEKEKGKRLAKPGSMRQLPPERESLGLAIDGVKGPGHRFEIDATKLQVQLVSRYGRTELVGTPSLYIVIDVWSSAIVGYCFSLENFSWTMAATALANTFSNKQQVFDKLGLSNTQEDWPCNHLPTALMADRAELITDKGGGVPKIGIIVEIASPMCPEMKGTVESKFNEIKHQGTYRIPGTFPKNRIRREKDGKNDAALNIDELEKIVVQIILDINKQPLPAERIPPEFIESGNTDISRIGLYAWGIINKPGFTRTMSNEEYKYYLLTSGIGSITYDGIRFETHNFRPKTPMTQLLNEKNKKLGIRYNEHDVSQIHFYCSLTKSWEPAYNDNPNIQRRPVAFYEYRSFRYLTEKHAENIHNQNAHETSIMHKELSKIVRSAEIQAKQEKTVVKPRKSRQAIRDNQANEKNIGRRLVAQRKSSIIPEQAKTNADEVCLTPPAQSTIETLVDVWGGEE